MNPWTELGTPPGSDAREIKLAYARRIKQVHPENDAEGFQRLRRAYEMALRQSEEAAIPPADSRGQPQILTMFTPPPQALLARETRSGAAVAEVMQPPPEFAAQRLFAQLLNAPEGLRPALLARSRHAPGWEGLDFQAALEQAVIRGLAADFERLFPLIYAFDEHYTWPQNLDEMRGEDVALQSLLERYETRRRQPRPASSYKPVDRVRERALELLLQPIDHQAFRQFAKRWENLHAMGKLLRQSRSSDAVLPGLELNEGSVNWWTRALPRMRSLEQRIMLLTLGLLLSPLALVMAHWLAQDSRFDLETHPRLARPLFVFFVCLPLLFDTLLIYLRVHDLVDTDPSSKPSAK